MNGFDDLIEALQIFRKYGNPRNPTICEHDILYIVGVATSDVSAEDKSRLEELGFVEDGDCFISFRYGSA